MSDDLALKYRPKSFDEVVGNEAQIKAVKDALAHGNHVFLFTGDAGTGKTTLARICAAYLEASELDVHEINSSDNRGIDTAREIIEQTRYNPIDGKSVCWIIDEVHKATADWQNAMLRVLEEPPSYCYFFLCTTDPQKLISPLKTRCSIITTKLLDDVQMRQLLKRVMAGEEKKCGSEVLAKLMEVSGGCARRALKLLGKILWQEDEETQLEILDSDDSEGSAESIELCRVLVNEGATWAKVAEVLAKLDLTDCEGIRRQVLGYACAVALKQKKPSSRVIAMLEAFEAANTFVGKGSVFLACLRVCAG
jgi:DNA polymerase-3 subunit gamma/tau